MSTTVTATYASADAMKNAVNDLLGAGIPQEKYFIDESALQIKKTQGGRCYLFIF